MLLHKEWPLVTGLILIVLTLFACQSEPTLVEPAAPGIGVGITSDECPNVIVNVGYQVAWTNQDRNEHIVRASSSEGNVLFESGTLQSGDSFTYTFIEPGTYTYVCTADGSMTGTVTVQP